MGKEFHICVACTENQATTYDQLAYLLQRAFDSLNLPCVVAENELDENKINILLGYHLMRQDKKLLSCHYIPYQLEQLDELFLWLPEEALRILRNAPEVWDCSRHNIEVLSKKFIEAKFVPIGYHEALTVIEHKEDKDIDILFYGTINERRKKILDELSGGTTINAIILQDPTEAERNEHLARARIILNIHLYDNHILESSHVSFLLNNSCFVLCEHSAENPYRELGLYTASYSRLIDECYKLLRDPKNVALAGERIGNDFKKHFAMADIIKRVIEG